MTHGKITYANKKYMCAYECAAKTSHLSQAIDAIRYKEHSKN